MSVHSGQEPSASTEAAQRLRLRRILLGCVSYACTALIVACTWWLGFLDAERVVHFVIAISVVNALALALVRTGLNLRLEDPSLTGPLVVASLGPVAYIMYHVNDPTVRVALLLLASVAMLFGLFYFELRGMLRLAAIVLLSYLVTVAALIHWAPERVNLRAEVLVVIAYTLVLVQSVVVGSFVAGLKRLLREKNHSLRDAMLELEELATRDPLTRLPNRRTAMHHLDEELSRTERRRRGGDGLCIALLDVDHFKLVNDRCGHQAGDEVLQLLGEIMSALIRSGDFVARFGGEEFLVILPETTVEGAVAALDRMREAIAACPPERLPTPGPVTVSIGLARHEPGDRVEVTLGRADEALYQAKHEGRNRVVAWSAGPDRPPEAAGLA